MTPYPVHLDGRVMVKGTYSSADNLTTFTLPVADPLADTIVLTDDFGDEAGKILTPSSVIGKTVTVPGRYHNRNVIIGRSCPMVLTLSRQYMRDEKGQARVEDRFQIEVVTISHANSGDYTIRSKMKGRVDRTKKVEVSPDSALESDDIHCKFAGEAAAQTITIEADGPRPVTIVGTVFAGTSGPGRA